MTYIIDAQLEQGTPSLTLIDAVTGEKRFYWRGDNVPDGECDWQNLFKRLMLFSCADRLNFIQRAKSTTFGNECIECATCVDQDVLTKTQELVFSTKTENTNTKSSIVSLLRLQK